MNHFELLVVPGGWKSRVANKITELASQDWQNRLEIYELPKCDMQRSEASSVISKVAKTTRATRVLLCRGTAFENVLLRADGIRFFVLDVSARQLIQGDARSLKRLLAERGLDVETNIKQQIAIWSHGSGDEAALVDAWVTPRIDLWRRQFIRVDAELGSAVADAVLRNIEVMPTSRVAACVQQHGIAGGYGFVLDGFGKSWGVVLNALVKNPCAAKGTSVLPLHEAIPAARNSGLPVRVIEDGLFSATELSGVIESLMGVRQLGDTEHALKTPPLLDPMDMYNVSQQWAYGCVTDYGQYMFSAVVKAWGLHSMTVAISPQTKSVNVLRPEGHSDIRRALSDLREIPWSPSADSDERKANLKAFQTVLKQHVVPAVASNMSQVADAGLIKKTVGLCADIGEQLWDGYLSGRFGEFDRTRWPKERLRQCGLGKDGLGLAFLFSHSAPKATLPVLWAKGAVRAADGTYFVWEPLFPGAR